MSSMSETAWDGGNLFKWNISQQGFSINAVNLIEFLLDSTSYYFGPARMQKNFHANKE